MAPNSRTIVAKRGRPFSAIDRPMNRERDLLESATRSMTPRRATTRPNRTGSRLRSCDGHGCFHSLSSDSYPLKDGPHRRLSPQDLNEELPVWSEHRRDDHPSPKASRLSLRRAVGPGAPRPNGLSVVRGIETDGGPHRLRSQRPPATSPRSTRFRSGGPHRRLPSQDIHDGLPARSAHRRDDHASPEACRLSRRRAVGRGGPPPNGLNDVRYADIGSRWRRNAPSEGDTRHRNGGHSTGDLASASRRVEAPMHAHPRAKRRSPVAAPRSAWTRHASACQK